MHLQGAASQTVSTASNVLGTISPGAPQNRVIYTIVHTFDGTYADIAMSPNGQIALIDPRPPAVKDLSFVSLEGITYGNNVINPIPVNVTYWLASAGLGPVSPGWYKDAFGIMDLVGAAKQSATGGSNPNLLRTLPPAASPSVVYTIVHTFNGTYADIAINPNGQIDLIDPKPPAVKDYRLFHWSASPTSSNNRAFCPLSKIGLQADQLCIVDLTLAEGDQGLPAMVGDIS